MAKLQIHIYICLTDRNYVQEDSCLPNRASIHKELADTVPLAHDDLGCPIRRDRLYQQDNMGAKAKSLSGPPVSPSLFRSPRSSAPERPSPKAIQASIKESATLAAAISMQWKEEVSAMRRELAELRRDLCKELRAFNSNFNTFTQHYNTWSPQGGDLGAGADVDFGAGARAGAGTGTGPRAGAGGLGTSAADRGTGGAREKKPHVSTVSVGTQARSKVLVRQSTADAAVNCPEEKEDKKGARHKLPKQLSMDPSILACPQSMYVESAIPLSLDPILPNSVRTGQPETVNLAPSTSKADSTPESEAPDHEIVRSSDRVMTEPAETHSAVPVSSDTALESPKNSNKLKEQVQTTPLPINRDTDNASLSHTKQSHPDEMQPTDSKQIERDKIQLPYPVPVVTVSPPDDNDFEIVSDPESPDPVSIDKPDPLPEDGTPEPCLESDKEPVDPKDLEQLSDIAQSFDPINHGPLSVCDAPVVCLDTVTQSTQETTIGCPSIVISEYLDTSSPTSPTDSDTNPDPVITFPDYPTDPSPEQTTSTSTFTSSAVEISPSPEPEPQDPEWPPLPEPLDTTPIYHADLVHFDLVMLTSLDQDDLDSVFMDPEPEPFDLSIDSPSNTEDLDPPVYQLDCSSSLPPTVDPATHSPLSLSQSAESVCVDPAMEYRLAHMPQEVASDLHGVHLPLVTVTISPPSSVSPGSSIEMDFPPTSQAIDTDQSPPELEPSVDLPQSQSDDQLEETPGSIAVPQQSEVFAVKEEIISGAERPSSDQAFLWHRWQKKAQRGESMHRSASVELWSGRYEYNSAEITYVSLTL